MKSMNEIKICITLNGSELCRNYTVEELADLDTEKMGAQMVDILDTLKESDKPIFDNK